MKLATYETDGGAAGRPRRRRRAAVCSTSPPRRRAVGWDPAPFASMLALIDADDVGLDLAARTRRGPRRPWAPLAEVSLLAPAAGAAADARRACRSRPISASPGAAAARWRRARRAARRRSARRWRSRPNRSPKSTGRLPIYYITNRFIVAGPETTVRWPRYSQVMDYELEIAIVTRRTRANIPEGEAADHIFGYTIFNDFSARDRQRVEMARPARPRQGQELRRRQRAGAVDRHAGRTRRPRRRCKSRCGSTARRAPRARRPTCCSRSRRFSPTPRRTRRSTPARCSAPAQSAIAAAWRSAAFSKAATRSNLHVDRIGVLRNRVVAQID